MRCWALLPLVAAACQWGDVEPVPLRGGAPATIAIWPWIGEHFQPALELLTTGLDPALRQRGYRVVPLRVGEELLLAAGILAADADPAAAGRVLACDAVLQCVVRDFAAVGTRPLEDARWDVEWRLVSTTGAGVQWTWAHRGSWVLRQGDFGDPHRRLDAEPDVVPIGGLGPGNYRDATELVAALHRMAMSYLPQRPR